MFTKTLIAASLTLASVGAANATVTYTFQEGVAGYPGTQDTQVAMANPSTNYGSQTSFTIDGDDPNGTPLQPVQGLMRFDNIFGTAAGQIKPTDTINSATLRIEVRDAGSGFSLHNMLSSWSESSTWNSLASGVSVNGVEAQTSAVFTVGANNSTANVPTGFLTINVLGSLAAWQAGTIANNGWLFNPFSAGTNGIDVRLSESSVIANRPLLTVSVTPIPEPSEIALMLAGLGLIGGIARKRKAT